MPLYSPSSNSYNINHNPIPAGVAHTLNSNNVNSMMDAKTHLYMISTGKYSNWSAWETNPGNRLNITTNAGYLVQADTVSGVSFSSNTYYSDRDSNDLFQIVRLPFSSFQRMTLVGHT